MADQEQLITLTADIVAAHVSNNSVAVGDVASLVKQVHGALAGLGGAQQPDAAPAKMEPAVSVRSSIKHDSITCLVCGSKQKTLKRHLGRAHDMTPQQYREEFDLKADYPMVAPDYADKRRDLAKASGLGTLRTRDSGRAAKARGKP